VHSRDPPIVAPLPTGRKAMSDRPGAADAEQAQLEVRVLRDGKPLAKQRYGWRAMARAASRPCHRRRPGSWDKSDALLLPRSLTDADGALASPICTGAVPNRRLCDEPTFRRHALARFAWLNAEYTLCQESPWCRRSATVRSGFVASPAPCRSRFAIPRERGDADRNVVLSIADDWQARPRDCRRTWRGADPEER